MTLTQPRQPPAMLNASARGTLQAEELLGKSKCQLLPCFDQTHSMEGIELLPAESDFECPELDRPRPTLPIVGDLESSEQPQPVAGALASLIGQTNPTAGDLESSEQPQPIAGVLASLIGQTNPIEGKLDHPMWPENLVEIIQSVTSMKIRKPTKPEFAFDMSMEAAERNYLLLKKYDCSLAVALQAQGDSPLSMGSEFRPLDVLQAIYGRHPIWERMVSLLKNGSTWPLDPIDEGLRQSDLQEALEFGNHKGEKQNPELLLELVSKDVKHGYAVTFPLSKAVSIQGISLAPMNIMHQNSIDELGRIVEKDRLTHDQSFMFGSEMSVNSRARTDDMLPCMLHVWSVPQTTNKLGVRGKGHVSEHSHFCKQGRLQVCIPPVPSKSVHSASIVHTS